MEENSELLVTVDVNDQDDDAATTAEPTALSEASDEATSRVDHIVESVLFAAAAPVSLRKLVEILDGPTIKEVQAALGRLREQYGPGRRGIQLHEVAGGYQLRTARENAEWVRAVFRDKPARLGRAALETLAIIAYKQPATRAEIEVIRGVDVDGVVTTLLSRRLIKIAGRKEAVGRPLLYSTTPEFLEVFGLKDLAELPSLKELGPLSDAEEITAAAAATADTADATLAGDDAVDDTVTEPSVLGDTTDSADTTESADTAAAIEAEPGVSDASASAAGTGTGTANDATIPADEARGEPTRLDDTTGRAAADTVVGDEPSHWDDHLGEPAGAAPFAAPPAAGSSAAESAAEPPLPQALTPADPSPATEAAEPRGDHLAAQGRGADRGRSRKSKRRAGDAAGDEGEPADRSDHD